MHSVQMVRLIRGMTVSWRGTMDVWQTGQLIKPIYLWAILKKKKSHISLHLPMPLQFVMPTIVPCTPEQMRTALFI